MPCLIVVNHPEAQNFSTNGGREDEEVCACKSESILFVLLGARILHYFSLYSLIRSCDAESA